MTPDEQHALLAEFRQAILEEVQQHLQVADRIESVPELAGVIERALRNRMKVVLTQGTHSQ